MRLPSSAPASVITFHSVNTPTPVAQKPSFRSRWSGWAAATAVDSSVVTCAIRIRWARRGRNQELTCIT